MEWFIECHRIWSDRRLAKKGIPEALSQKDGTPDGVLAEFLGEFSGNIMDFYRIIRQIPFVCDLDRKVDDESRDSKQPASRKRKITAVE